MLEDCLVESRRPGAGKKPWMVGLSVSLHCLGLLVLVLVPLFQLQVLPQIRTVPPLPPLRSSDNARVRIVELRGSGSSTPPRTDVAATAAITPQVIPAVIVLGANLPDPDLVAAPASSGRAGSGASRLGLDSAGGQDAGFPIPAPPVPVNTVAPPPQPTPIRREPLRVGGFVQQANLIAQQPPAYPRLAIQARVQGAVVLEAVITRQGTVESLRVISGHPLLVQAALDAVSRWRYRPTLLNGEPVEVITNITVNFNFQ